MPHPLFERHAATLDRAQTAIADRGYWSPHSESPKAYGEGEGAELSIPRRGRQR